MTNWDHLKKDLEKIVKKCEGNCVVSQYRLAMKHILDKMADYEQGDKPIPTERSK